MCDLGNANIGIGQQRPSDIEVVVAEFGRAPSGTTRAPSGGEARLGALPDQTALEFRQCAERCCIN